MKKLFAILVLLVATSAFAQSFTFPSNPTVDQIVIGPAGQEFKWDGAKWVAMLGNGAGASQPPVVISATAPVAPASGTLWFDTANVQLYIWYNTGTTSQWAPVAHP